MDQDRGSVASDLLLDPKLNLLRSAARAQPPLPFVNSGAPLWCPKKDDYACRLRNSGCHDDTSNGHSAAYECSALEKAVLQSSSCSSSGILGHYKWFLGLNCRLLGRSLRKRFPGASWMHLGSCGIAFIGPWRCEHSAGNIRNMDFHKRAVAWQGSLLENILGVAQAGGRMQPWDHWPWGWCPVEVGGAAGGELTISFIRI